VKLFAGSRCRRKGHGPIPGGDTAYRSRFAADAESMQLLMDHGAETRIAAVWRSPWV